MDSVGWRRKGPYETILRDADAPRGSSTAEEAESTRMLQINTGITRPRLLNKQHQGKGIDRFGVSWQKAALYWGDLFHTLLNMPRWRFITIFFAIYVTEYLLFALLYFWQPNSCVPHVHHFKIALWFSVQTAATIGYGAPLAPNPQCTMVNMFVMFQVISSSLIDYCCMGLVFARFSAPSKRSSSMRFSNSLVVHPHEASGYWCVALRVANMRKHIMIRPEIQIMLAKPDNPGQSAFVCQELQLEDPLSSKANLRLGLAVTLVHVIRPGSPLWDLSIDDLLLQEMEVMVFFEGVDAMTSNSVQARYSYYPTDMHMNERFATLYMMYKGQRLGLDFSEFDATVSLSTSEASAMMRRRKFSDLMATAREQLAAQAASRQQAAAADAQHWANGGTVQQDQQASDEQQRQVQQQQQQPSRLLPMKLPGIPSAAVGRDGAGLASPPVAMEMMPTTAHDL